jgi:2-beta-glucuronyltransferase
MAKKVVLVTLHYWNTKRRAGFHHLAQAYCNAGWDVLFLTVHISWLTRLRGIDNRLAYPVVREANRITEPQAGLSSFVWMTPWHITNPRNKLLNLLSRPFSMLYEHFPLGAAKDYIRSADLVIFESTPGLTLFERFKRLNTRARFVYRASDDLGLLGVSPVVREALEKAIARFDLISLPSQYAFNTFASCKNASLHYHGVAKEIFDQPCANPFEPSSGSQARTNAVFVGCSHVDMDFLARSSRLMPDWAFHVIGPLSGLPRAANIIAYGEMPFLQTLPYIKHADIGLQIRTAGPGAQSLADSLKVIQYTYCRLPIVAPEFLRCGRSNFFYYQPGDDNSIATALRAARDMDRDRVDTTGIHTWDELAMSLSG